MQLAEILPPQLKTDPAQADSAWSSWVMQHDREIRARLQRGDEETVVNWLLFGTTFTKHARVPLDGEAKSTLDRNTLAEMIARRAVDLAEALATPGQDERRLFAREMFMRQGYAVQSPADRLQLAQHLGTLATNVLEERAKYAGELAVIRQLDSSSDQFAARSRLFRDRGLSLDTSFKPSFALEQTLAEMKRRGVVKAGAIRDIAVIGPGLDFTDKSSGYDFYPQQTLQPFAVIDSLIRLGLATDATSVRLTTLDLSPRVNDHLARTRQKAAAGEPYRFRLPLERGVSWKAPVLTYWKAAGDRIGTTTAPASTSIAGTSVEVRTVTVRPAVARRIESADLNIVTQRADDRRFDLVVATNVFIYYDVLDQVLALGNVRSMLRQGGFLLSNNALLELPSSGMRSTGYLTVEYSNVADDGDHIVWYQAN